MVLMRGAPDPSTSYPTTILNGIEGKECAKKCSVDPYCVMSYGNSSLICYLYSVGDLIKIRYDSQGFSEGVDKVAFKIQETPTECATTSRQMFEGIPNTFSHPPIKSYQLVAETETSYVMDYEYTFTDSCSDWLDSKPSCSNCPVTMMSFRGVASLVSPLAPTVMSWKECMYACYNNMDCYMAYMSGYPNCRNAVYGNVKGITFMDSSRTPTSASGLYYAAVKYVSDETTCNLNFTQLWNAGRSLKAVATATNYSAYKPLSTASGATFTWSLKGVTCNNPNTFTIPDVSGCYTVIMETMNHSRAVERCAQIGGDGLMTIPNKESVTYIRNAFYSVSGYTNGYLHIGLTRKDLTSPWEWSLPGLEIDKSALVWNVGEPRATNKIAYLTILNDTYFYMGTAGESGGCTAALCHIAF